MLKEKKLFTLGLLLGLTIFKLAVPEVIEAASLPWEGPMEELADSITGPVAKFVTMIVMCGSGLMIMMGDGGSAGRLALRLVFGLSLAIGFMQIITMF